MYADDMVLFSESIEGLQSLLNELSNYCEAWKLSINVDKSNVLVFRKGGKSKPCENWDIVVLNFEFSISAYSDCVTLSKIRYSIHYDKR